MEAKKRWFVMGVLLLWGGGGALQGAAPPSLLHYQGVLRDASGAPREGSFDMLFRFYNGPIPPGFPCGIPFPLFAPRTWPRT